MFFAFGFAPGDHPLALQGAELRCDDSEAMFRVAVITKNDDPITRFAERSSIARRHEERCRGSSARCSRRLPGISSRSNRLCN